jgi:putative flavoprotein involved in K+ transport
MSQLPGYGYQGDDPDGFLGRDEVVRYLDAYAAALDPPLRCGTPVESLRRTPGTDRYLMRTAAQTIEARNVVATGAFQKPRIPSLSAALPAGILQRSSRDYRTPTQLPPGAVLVVGSGASGLQICEDLAASGRTVYLSVGRGQRWPRRYRGRAIAAWLHALGIFDEVGRRHYMDPKDGCTAVLTGVRGGHDLDYDRLVADGVILMGRLRGTADGAMLFADDLRESLTLWDASWQILQRMVDDYIQRARLDAPAAAGLFPAASRAWRSRPPRLERDLAACGITTVLWAMGCGLDFGWIDAPVLDATGEPIQRRGVTSSLGLYFLGLRRMHTIKSSFLGGGGDDAADVVEQIVARTSA